MIYFGATQQFIKLGYSSEHGLLKRLETHRRNWGPFGWTVLAVMHGTVETESKLKEYFKGDTNADDTREQFDRGSQIESYIISLLRRGYACVDPGNIQQCPEVPYSAIDPSKLSDHAIDADGQYNLFSFLPIEERVRLQADANPQNHSFTDEWYTPEEWIERARRAMGSIDTDPATSAHVNAKFIKAKTFYTLHTNGLDYSRPWIGNVWLNPPYGRGDNSAGSFIERLAWELENKSITQAITCLNLNSMSSLWFTSYIPKLAKVHCIAFGRPDFIAPDDKPNNSSPTKGTVFSYFGGYPANFIEVFQLCGQILLPYQ